MYARASVETDTDVEASGVSDGSVGASVRLVTPRLGFGRFVFDGGVLSSEFRENIRLAPDELTAYAFHDVACTHELTIARLARRIVHGHAARHDGSSRYLEHGQPISWEHGRALLTGRDTSTD